MKTFASEQSLTEQFMASQEVHSIQRYAGWTRWEAREVEGLFGVPDVVIAFGRRHTGGKKLVRAFAFELKRENWRQALVQAYRYAAFAHYSSVVLDAAYIHRALAHLELFRRSNLGLLSVNVSGHVVWHRMPHFQTPYSDLLHRKFLAVLDPHLFGEFCIQSRNEYEKSMPTD